MKTAGKTRRILLAALVLALAVAAVFGLSAAIRPKLVDPHAGQVYLFDGFDWIWMTPLEGVDVNRITENDIVWENGVPRCTLPDYETLRGVDVSEHQFDIDWPRVAASGVDFAFIRIARRGYSEGGLFEDDYFKTNIEGAQAAGLKVGVYFFSQAITVQEAIEEAEMTLELLEPYHLELPVVYDWEKIYENPDEARTTGLASSTLSDCAVAFCETVKNAGYTPAVYFNRHTGYYGLDLSRMNDYVFWFALPQSDWPSFYYRVDIWQYSFSERVPGISTETDMNLIFVPKQ